MKKLPIACLLCCLLLPAARAELPDPVRFSIALELGDRAAAQRWLDAGLDPDFEGQLIGTGLMIAAWEGNIALLELFHRHGAQIDYVNSLGETALMLAAWKNRQDAVRWLLERGARPNPGNGAERQWTALHYAAFAGHADIAERLLAAGADVNARSTNGSTVVMMATREGHADLAQRLHAAGANPALRNDYGDDAPAWAMRHGHYALAKALASAENFATLADQATEQPAPPPPLRSEPAPDRVDELLRKARLAAMEGEREAAMRAYRQAWDALQSSQVPQKIGTGRLADPVQAQSPRALVIRAKRGKPEQQTLSMIYADGATASVDQLLEEARAAAAAGRRQEALQLFRQVAARLRDIPSPP